MNQRTGSIRNIFLARSRSVGIAEDDSQDEFRDLDERDEDQLQTMSSQSSRLSTSSEVNRDEDEDDAERKSSYTLRRTKSARAKLVRSVSKLTKLRSSGSFRMKSLRQSKSSSLQDTAEGDEDDEEFIAVAEPVEDDEETARMTIRALEKEAALGYSQNNNHVVEDNFLLALRQSLVDARDVLQENEQMQLAMAMSLSEIEVANEIHSEKPSTTPRKGHRSVYSVRPRPPAPVARRPSLVATNVLPTSSSGTSQSNNLTNSVSSVLQVSGESLGGVPEKKSQLTRSTTSSQEVVEQKDDVDEVGFWSDEEDEFDISAPVVPSTSPPSSPSGKTSHSSTFPRVTHCMHTKDFERNSLVAYEDSIQAV